jgi:transposase
MIDINDIVEECASERFYVFRGHAGATAIELVYDGHRAVFNTGSKSRSLIAAKTALRAYKALHGLDGFWPSERWATMTPVFAETRDAELAVLAEIDRVRFANAQRRVLQ